jgi:hypothetical protein
MEPRPFSIKLFLADGTAEGLRIVEKSNWPLAPLRRGSAGL